MALAGAGGAAAAVPAGAPTQQHHLIPGDGAQAAHVFHRRRAHHRADLHALGGVAWVIDLIHVGGGQADLVAVGAVACGGGGDQLALGQLAGQGILHRAGGVRRTGDPHGLVHVAPAGQGVPDGAADAGGRAAEGLDLGGVVVGFVLKQQEPLFPAAVQLVHRQFDGAGVDLLGLVQVVEQPLGLQRLGADGGQIHQGDRPVPPAQGLPLQLVAAVSGLRVGVLKAHLVDVGEEGGVAAVIGPIGIDHPQLGEGGVPLFPLEIALAEGDVRLVHGQAVLADHAGQALGVQGGKAGEGGHGFGPVVGHAQGLDPVQGGFPLFHRVDQMLFDGCHLVPVHLSVEQVDLGGAHRGPVALGHELHALGGGVRPLVKLAGQVFAGQHAIGILGQVLQHLVQGGL